MTEQFFGRIPAMLIFTASVVCKSLTARPATQSNEIEGFKIIINKYTTGSWEKTDNTDKKIYTLSAFLKDFRRDLDKCAMTEWITLTQKLRKKTAKSWDF